MALISNVAVAWLAQNNLDGNMLKAFRPEVHNADSIFSIGEKDEDGDVDPELTYRDGIWILRFDDSAIFYNEYISVPELGGKPGAFLAVRKQLLPEIAIVEINNKNPKLSTVIEFPEKYKFLKSCGNIARIGNSEYGLLDVMVNIEFD